MEGSGAQVDIPVLTEKDIDDLQNFCCKNKMDFVAASFVQSADDVRFIRLPHFCSSLCFYTAAARGLPSMMKMEDGRPTIFFRTSMIEAC